LSLALCDIIFYSGLKENQVSRNSNDSSRTNALKCSHRQPHPTGYLVTKHTTRQSVIASSLHIPPTDRKPLSLDIVTQPFRLTFKKPLPYTDNRLLTYSKNVILLKWFLSL